jgi:hypothetical protein
MIPLETEFVAVTMQTFLVELTEYPIVTTLEQGEKEGAFISEQSQLTRFGLRRSEARTVVGW